MNEEFKALEDKIDLKLESYRKEIHKLAQEPITSTKVQKRRSPLPSPLK